MGTPAAISFSSLVLNAKKSLKAIPGSILADESSVPMMEKFELKGDSGKWRTKY
jgi:hypothetical protein